MLNRRPLAARTAHIFFGVLALATAAPLAQAGFDPFTIAGTTLAASIQGKVDELRTAIGGVNNANNPGPLASGRREINWDGGGATVAAVSGATLSAFTNTRGGTFNTTGGTGFLQTPLNVMELTNIQASYETTFSTFSPVRIFTPTGSNVTDITFSVPGTAGATPATVSAFGAVFSDVDAANTTKIEFFDLSNAMIYLLNVPPGSSAAAPSSGLSFAGARANAGELIARIRITTGNQALGAVDSNGSPVDVVVMDDFIYSEPRAVPEPGTVALLVAAAIAGARLGALRRR